MIMPSNKRLIQKMKNPRSHQKSLPRTVMVVGLQLVVVVMIKKEVVHMPTNNKVFAAKLVVHVN